MERLQILVDQDLATRVRQVARRKNLTVSAYGAEVLREALRGQDVDADPWYQRKSYPAKPGTEHVTAEDHDAFLYGMPKRRKTTRRRAP